MRQTWIALVLLLGQGAVVQAERFVVEKGEARAEIVVAEKPQRSVRLAAQELQDGLRKISGGRVPIVTQPSPGRVRLYVGRSEHTDRLKIATDDLREGAFRLVSGEDWLTLIGQDSEFTPIEPWGKNNADLVSGKPLREWQQQTNSLWGLPNWLIYKDRIKLPGSTGLPDAELSSKPPLLEVWAQDERGSFNAVCGWLMRLGMRWYAPGEVGEIVPSLKSIALPTIDETVRPDFAIRRFNVRFATHSPDMVFWSMRMGLRDPYGIEAAHGMDTITDREEVFAAHPDWFAMVGGKRRYQRGANNHLCYSNEELLSETVRYVRASFDHFKMDVVSVMPPDGYTSICQCPKCAGKDSPERDQRGLASDYIWDFVNRVAREVRKTHPDRKVLNCAYGIYTLPPLKIEKLEPNVVVSIVGGRRPMNNKPEQQAECQQLRDGWQAKTSNPLIIFENYPFTDRGWYLPAFTPHSLGESINATKGISQGEDIWLSVRPGFEKEPELGLNHFMVYFTQRLYWGGRTADADALFREYCRLFYGPAEPEMLAFFAHCEANWQAMEKDKSLADTALELFEKAKKKVDANGAANAGSGARQSSEGDAKEVGSLTTSATSSSTNIFARRLSLIDGFLKGLRNKATQLGKKRGPVPVLRLVSPASEKIVIDGRLDDAAWVNAYPSATVKLRELQTGRQPTFGTTVKSAWLGNNLYFAIRCDERKGEKPNSTTTRKDDSALWSGDAIEVLLETEGHSYYQIAVNPDGAVCDLDRGVSRDKWFTWDAKAEVATHIAEDHWVVEMRLPLREDENDPLNQVVGHMPTPSLPWHFNVCRQRVRDDGIEYSSFSPTGTDGFHVISKFATYFRGNSTRFEHGPADDDFLEALRIGNEQARRGQREEALQTLIAAADRKVSDLQQAHALEQAAAIARHLKQPDVAAQLMGRIRLDAAKKAARMQHLLDTAQAPIVITEFGAEDFSKWPFWKRGDGLHARGRAYFITKNGDNAEADLTAALDWVSEPRTRDALLLLHGLNRELNLKNDESALSSYSAIVAGREHIGGADEFAALQGIARIQTRQKRFDEAIKTLRRANPESLQGVWKTNILKSIEDVQKARGE